MKNLLFLLILALVGCSNFEINEVKTKLKGGPEFRDDGLTHHERWTSQVGLETKLSNGHTVGVSYRRRDNSHIDGYDKHDNGVWLEYSFPVWKRPNTDRTVLLEQEVKGLRQELEMLKKRQHGEQKTYYIH